MPALNQLGRRYGGRGLVVLAVNAGESRSKFEAYTRGNRCEHLTWVGDSSHKISNLYKVRRIPVTYILDREGVIQYAHVGYCDALAETFAREIESLLE